MNGFNKFFEHKILIATILFLSSLLVYKLIYTQPRNWYDHYRYLAKSFMHLTVTVPEIPPFYQDAVIVDGRVLLPFAPMPAVVMLPFLKLVPQITQQQISIILAAINVGLIYLLISHFTKPKLAIILAIFYAFGTVAFWTSVVGTTWYLAHTTAVTFLSLSLIAHQSRRSYLSGFLFFLAVFCRYPLLFGTIFFVIELWNDKKRLLKFFLGMLPLFPIHFLYNYIRFRDIFEMGYRQVYDLYTNGNWGYSFLRIIDPNAAHFGYLDIRNIPLHLITFLVLPPLVSEKFFITPSPFGMGILFASPLLFLALIPKWKPVIERNLLIGVCAIGLAEFLHYSQGWVQFGYRFAMDFLPFLMILLAIRFKPKWYYLLLLIFSIAVNFWGTKWAIHLGW